MQITIDIPDEIAQNKTLSNLFLNFGMGSKQIREIITTFNQQSSES